MTSITYPVVVPEHITAALRAGEVAMLDADTGEWFGLDGDQQRLLSPERGIVQPRPGVFECTHCRAMWSKSRGGELHEATCPNHEGSLPIGGRPLRPLTRASANDLRSRLAAMNPDDHALLDEARRFYERGGAAS
jgi:hypothetical protein